MVSGHIARYREGGALVGGGQWSLLDIGVALVGCG